MTAEMFGPAEAVTAGFFDRLVPADAARSAARRRRQPAISKINMADHAAAKERLRGEAIKMIRSMIDEDITPQYGEDRVHGAARPDGIERGGGGAPAWYEGPMTMNRAGRPIATAT